MYALIVAVELRDGPVGTWASSFAFSVPACIERWEREYLITSFLLMGDTLAFACQSCVDERMLQSERCVSNAIRPLIIAPHSHISKVKSLTLDTWTREQVDSMKAMGNTKSNAKFNPDERRNRPPTNVDEAERHK